uniref:SCP domain-containing protein n=1 Tax=Bursaphelenchus xylophilus TaxID=6326 RepID=A0A1I7SJR5_BURXY
MTSIDSTTRYCAMRPSCSQEPEHDDNEICSSSSTTSARKCLPNRTTPKTAGYSLPSVKWTFLLTLLCSLANPIFSRHVEGAKLKDECFHRYQNKDHHTSLAEWIHRKNTSHYSPIIPSYSQALIKIEVSQQSYMKTIYENYRGGPDPVARNVPFCIREESEMWQNAFLAK